MSLSDNATSTYSIDVNYLPHFEILILFHINKHYLICFKYTYIFNYIINKLHKGKYNLDLKLYE